MSLNDVLVSMGLFWGKGAFHGKGRLLLIKMKPHSLITTALDALVSENSISSEIVSPRIIKRDVNRRAWLKDLNIKYLNIASSL